MARSAFVRRLKSRLKRIKNSSATSNTSEHRTPRDTAEPWLQWHSPVGNYYQQMVKSNLSVFSRFALQSRSLVIRDVFARAATSGQHALNDLLAVLESRSVTNEKDLRELIENYDSEILLALADLIANSARSDLDTHASLQIFDFVYEIHGRGPFLDHHKLQYLEASAETARYGELERLAGEFSLEELAPLQYELFSIQRVRQSSASPDDWVEAMNGLYSSLGMSPIRLCSDKTLPLLDRLMAQVNESKDGPKVSVIMPTFSPGAGIWTAVRSLLEQTWQNIEIIVVDDASPDDFTDVFIELGRLDPRLRVVRQAENLGAYVARNAGLALATGDFVTTHDDDDWSHPEKIGRQVNKLVEDDDLVATTSAHIRTTEEMFFQRVNTHPRYMQMNYSSLMFRRSITTEIGSWDTVNRGGDSEFLTRVIENYGRDSVVELMNEPLSFSRVWAGSLTSGEMSRGYFANSRLLYRWAFRQWHWDAGKAGEKAVRDVDAPRPYAVPSTFEPGERNSDLGTFDVIYATDFFRQSKYVKFVMEDVVALQEQGFRVGYMHLLSPQTLRPAGFPKELFELQRQGKIMQVAHDDTAKTKLLVVYDAAIGMFLDELESSVVSSRSIVIDRQLPSLDGEVLRDPVLVSQSVRHLDKAFNNTFNIVGATSSDQERLCERIPNGRLLPDSMIWRAHIKESPKAIVSPRSGAIPIVGFHSYGNRYRWPVNSTVFRNVYISPHFKTRFFGSLETARSKFGDELFEHIELPRAEAQHESDFLSSLDFWVYYPHDRLQEQVWLPVLSAMQAGKVVILPRRLERVYGAAAVYADADEVSSVVSKLTVDTSDYVRQAERGQEFVASYYTRETFMARINNLTSEDPPWVN